MKFSCYGQQVDLSGNPISKKITRVVLDAHEFPKVPILHTEEFRTYNSMREALNSTNENWRLQVRFAGCEIWFSPYTGRKLVTIVRGMGDYVEVDCEKFVEAYDNAYAEAHAEAPAEA